MNKEKEIMDKNKEIMEKETIFDSIAIKNNVQPGKLLGSGGFGIVKEVNYKGKILAGKLMEKENNKKVESDIVNEFKGPNIIKIIAKFSDIIDKKKYDLIIMEKASIKDLKTLGNYINNENNNLFKLIFKKPFEEKISDNFMRYFCKNIINGLETFDRGDLIHSDIKPENILIFMGLIFKLSDFGLLSHLSDMRRDKNKNPVHLLGGTPGYLIPEYYESNEMTEEVSKTQDYFSLGATIYFLKYGKKMLKYNEDRNDKKSNSDNIIDLLQDINDKIKTTKNSNKYFISFICNLIQYKGEDRPTFEQIYRNKWLNKYTEELNEIVENYGNDEAKLIKELFKSDFIIKKQKYLNNLIQNENNNNNNNESDYRKHKFIFKNKKK